jgi:hypothetical protein
VSYYLRYFADRVVTLKAIGAGLVAVDPAFKIDGGDLMRGKDILAEIEINTTGSDLFGEDLTAKINDLERAQHPNARHVIQRLRGTQAIVTLHVLDSALDPDVAWEMLSPVWTVLPALSAGLTQSDGQGFYDGSQLVVALP